MTKPTEEFLLRCKLTGNGAKEASASLYSKTREGVDNYLELVDKMGYTVTELRINTLTVIRP
jgi:hypothetical protein